MTAISQKSSLRGVGRLAPAQTHRNHSWERGLDVLLADDYRSRRYQVWALLSAQSHVRAVSTGESVAEVLSLAAQHTPDLTIVSATFGVGECLSLAHRLKHLPHALHVLIYANAVDARLAGAAMIAGADGVFDPEAGAEGLAEVLGRIAAGEHAFPALVPDPFNELVDQVDEEDRRIVAMLLLRETSG